LRCNGVLPDGRGDQECDGAAGGRVQGKREKRERGGSGLGFAGFTDMKGGGMSTGADADIFNLAEVVPEFA